jgi:signal peptidase I
MAVEAKTIRFPQWLRHIVIGRNPKWTLARLAFLIVAVLVIFNFVLTPPIRVTGRSMLPTFHDGQINFLNRLAYVSHDPQRGDVVGLRYSGEHVMLLKRIVGLPGEDVSFENGKLLINGEPLEEPYVKKPWYWTHRPLHLGPNEYYVVGDNRSMSWDDHEHGAAGRQRIVGKVLFGGGS